MSNSRVQPCDVSVVVPTFNRCASLLRLLASLDRQTLDAGRFEIVVVDNNSTDGTREQVAAYARSCRARLRCLRETAQGAAYARNRGILETAAPIVAFTDDDAEVDPKWLEEILGGLEAHSADAVGGRTEASWGGALPDWWLAEYEKAFLRNWGDEACRVTAFPFFYSINLAVRRLTLSAVGHFDPRLGPKRGAHVVGEDADLCQRIHERGGLLVYLPRAVVQHHVESARLSKRFLRRRFYYSGATHVLQRAIRDQAMELPYQAKALIEGFVRWLASSPGRERFRRELDIWYRAGALVKGLNLKLSPQDARNRSSS